MSTTVIHTLGIGQRLINVETVQLCLTGQKTLEGKEQRALQKQKSEPWIGIVDVKRLLV